MSSSPQFSARPTGTSSQPEKLEFVLYRSRATGVVSDRLIANVLMKSVENNKRDRVTGFLHWEQDVFVQYIEGPRIGLMRRLEAIFGDRRHRQITVLGEGRTSKRLFPDWDMGLLDSPVVPRALGQGYGDWVRGLEELTRDELLQALAEQGGQFRRVDIQTMKVA